jgi:hypothetical protein
VVGPISEGERAAFTKKLKVGVAALVGVSGGLVALQVDATLLQTVAAVAAGLAVGAVLAWYIVPSGPMAPDRRSRSRPERDNPFADGGQSGDEAGEQDRADRDRDGRSRRNGRR